MLLGVFTSNLLIPGPPPRMGFLACLIYFHPPFPGRKPRMFQSVFWFVCFCLILWGHKISWVAIAHERQPLRQHVCEVCDPVCVCVCVSVVGWILCPVGGTHKADTPKACPEETVRRRGWFLADRAPCALLCSILDTMPSIE